MVKSLFFLLSTFPLFFRLTTVSFLKIKHNCVAGILCIICKDKSLLCSNNFVITQHPTIFVIRHDEGRPPISYICEADTFNLNLGLCILLSYIPPFVAEIRKLFCRLFPFSVLDSQMVKPPCSPHPQLSLHV